MYQCDGRKPSVCLAFRADDHTQPSRRLEQCPDLATVLCPSIMDLTRGANYVINDIITHRIAEYMGADSAGGHPG